MVRVARSQERQLFGAWTLAVTLNSAAGRVRPAEPLVLPTADFDRMGPARGLHPLAERKLFRQAVPDGEGLGEENPHGILIARGEDIPP